MNYRIFVLVSIACVSQVEAQSELPDFNIISADDANRPGEMPNELRRYFKSADQEFSEALDRSEKKIAMLESIARGSVGAAKMNTLLDIKKKKLSLEKLRKEHPIHYFDGSPSIGSIGSFHSMTVKAVIDEKTLLVATDSGVAIVRPIVTKSIKMGHRGLKGEVFIVTANSSQPIGVMRSELTASLVLKTVGRKKVTLVVEPIRKADVDRWRNEYEHRKLVDAIAEKTEL